MVGRIHSIETFGAVDGPGVRFVVFFQGCPMRCAYCHNPDTWDPTGGSEMSVEEIYEKFDRNRAFYENGGLTASGGEPMMQIEFLTKLFKYFHERGVHTCLDTSGIMFPGSKVSNEKGLNSISSVQNELSEEETLASGKKVTIESVNELMKCTDLVMLDIKQVSSESHKILTGKDNDGILEFAKYLSDHDKKMWVRFVCVPGVTDVDEELIKYGQFLKDLKTLEALDVLPYHTMGVKKYEALGIPYRLEGIKAADARYVKGRQKIILDAMKQ